MQEIMLSNDYSVEDIQSMNYFDLIGVVRETNRPPGGVTSIAAIAQAAFLNSSSRILEIGTSTGFTAIELAKLVKCKIIAIDVNPESLNEGKRRALAEGVEQYISFELQDAMHLSYENEYFDMVFCGNVISYLNNKTQAFKEFIRVLKSNGFVAAIPMYYLITPPEIIVEQVSKAINHPITVQYKNDWLNFFGDLPLSLFLCENYKFDFVQDYKIAEFVEKIMQRGHLNMLDKTTFSCLKERYRHFLNLFRDNLSLMGFSSVLLRKDVQDYDPVLFTSTKMF